MIASRPGCFIPEECNSVLSNRKLDGPQSRYGEVAKSPARNKTPAVQLIATYMSEITETSRCIIWSTVHCEKEEILRHEVIFQAFVARLNG